MQVRCRLSAFEHPVLEPFGFADDELVSCGLRRCAIGPFRGRMNHDEMDIDNWFGSKARNGRRAHVFNGKDRRPQGRANPPGLELELARPVGIVIDDFDFSVLGIHKSNYTR